MVGIVIERALFITAGELLVLLKGSLRFVIWLGCMLETKEVDCLRIIMKDLS